MRAATVALQAYLVSQLPYQVSQSVSQLETLEPLPDKDLSQSGKAGKPVSLLNEEIENDSTESQQPEESDCQKAERADKLPYLAYNPDTVSNVGLPTALPTALPTTQSGLPTASTLETTDSKTNNSDEPSLDPGEAQWLSSEYLPLLAESSPDELLDGVRVLFEVYGAAMFRRIWDATLATAQIKILQALMLTLPEGELRSLTAAVGVKL